MLDLLELEETVGRAWHRLIGATASYPVHAAEAATLAEVQGQIAVMFRALGGEAGVQIARVKARKSGHRLGWRQRIGLCYESSIIQAATGQRFFYPTGSLWFRIASSMRCSSLAGGMVRHGAGG